MCGIFGYIGSRNAIQIVIDGLKKLEYRGYDSAGLAGVKDNKLIYCKEVGKVAALEKAVGKQGFVDIHLAIGQTRWATHGKVTKANAHPHVDNKDTIAIVHNGIVENHEQLRKTLIEKGVVFVSETDTEVIAHLIASFYKGDLLQAVKDSIALLKGAFAIAIVHKDYPDQIIAVAHESPLSIGMGNKEAFLSSDSNSFVSYTKEAIFLSNGEIAVIKAGKIEVYNTELEQITKESQAMLSLSDDISKGSYAHFTLKEIFEQPQSLRSALLSRTEEEYGTAIFDELHFDAKMLLSVQRILILACGTSWHAGYIASYMMEELARIPVQVEISSEYRYKNPVVSTGTLVIAISQSGETADTVAAVRELKAKGVRILSICNVHGSTLHRESDACIFLRAGPEIGVCSTKAFTNQVIVLGLLTLQMARMQHMSKQKGQEFITALKALPEQVQKVLDQSSQIKALAQKYCHYKNFFFIGRRYMFPTSLEGALKLKEISYINANGYPAGEMKHGPIALINEECPTIALCANKTTYDKLVSNIMEIKARNGLILAIAEEGQDILDIADDVIFVPATIDELAPIPTTVATQLLAYYIALELGADVDHPRNLAKSVTVE